jgi:hypothetical protein
LKTSFTPLILKRKFGAAQDMFLDLWILILGSAPIVAINRSQDGGIHKHFE